LTIVVESTVSVQVDSDLGKFEWHFVHADGDVPVDQMASEYA
jgi:hypothetical protein